jgi:hypothetical protein
VAGGLTPAAAKLELSPGSKKPATMTQMRAGGWTPKTKNILSHHFHDWNIPSDWLCLTL